MDQGIGVCIIRFDTATIAIQADRIPNEFPILAKMTGLPVTRFHDCRHTAASIMRSLRIPPIIVAGMLGHSLAILMTRYAHMARFARMLAIFQGPRLKQLA